MAELLLHLLTIAWLLCLTRYVTKLDGAVCDTAALAVKAGDSKPARVEVRHFGGAHPTPAPSPTRPPRTAPRGDGGVGRRSGSAER